MKKAILYLLLFLLLFQNSGRLVVLAWFKLYQPQIVRTLCENRNRPELHCDGQCVLAKKLAEADRQQQAANWDRLTEVSIFMAPQHLQFAFDPAITALTTTQLPPYRADCRPVSGPAIFHPPCA
ncbi:hypothetical protein F5984_22385 [Rudanella paleaurantiibacter]|uniref:Uncharacterized protein n=1 Tax=Rudanella paleaurantiibacter TaxID=2614655 RepID=A0A7J5TTZ6_9BACT|nr:hypothetical protein [Rudanella paleaurantiibacter]KAB7727374.1 hypothetical protein F5984_22385 [Rudanella paleaurantiibacter]